MTELIVSLLFSVAALGAAAGLIKSEWERARCAYLTFEAVHAKLVGKVRFPDLHVRLGEDAIHVRGTGQCGRAREEVELPWLDQQGALSLPLVLALVVISLASFGAWSVMRRWRQVVEIQIRLDRCVGTTALELKHALGRIEEENLEIQTLRAAIAAASIAGGSGQSLKPALELEAARQELERGRWRLKEARWLIDRGCDREGDLPLPLPEMSWYRPPPDSIGAQPLQWEAGASKKLRVWLAHSPRAAAALVQTKDGGVASVGALIGVEIWKASWTPPVGQPRANFD